MRLYEVVYILDAALDEAAASTKLEKFHELATVGGGEVSAVDHWGPRQLAYPLQKASVGYYVVAHFTAAAEALPEFERLLKLDGEVLRYLLIINEGEPTSGASIMADLPVRASSDDETTTMRMTRMMRTMNRQMKRRMENLATQPAPRRNSLVREDVVVAWRARE